MSATEEEKGIRKNDRGELVLSLNALRPKPRWLEIGDETVKIPGSLTLGQMLEIQGLEEELKSADSTEETAKAALEAFTDLLNSIILDANRDLPDDWRLEMGIQEATHLLVFIASPDDSIAEAFIEAITNPKQGDAEKPDGVSDEAHELAQRAGLEDPESEEASRPLRSGKRSSRSSSRSAKSTAGRRSGGSTPAARSRRSGSTSASRSNGKPSASETTTD